MSKDIVRRKRIEALQQFSDIQRTIVSETRNSQSMSNINQTYEQDVSHTYDGRLRNMRQSTKDSQMNSMIESHRLNSWLNRSLDHNTHSRLYNDAKYHYARKAHRKRMSRDLSVQGCTFQPKLVTDQDLTMKM